MDAIEYFISYSIHVIRFATHHKLITNIACATIDPKKSNNNIAVAIIHHI